MTTENDVSLSLLMTEVGEAIVYADHQWVVRYCNDVYLNGLGLGREQVIGKTPMDYQPNFSRSIFYALMEQVFRDGKAVAQIGYSTILRRWLLVRAFPLKNGALMLANDASESIVKQHLLAGKAIKDPLTGLPNKLGLTTAVDELLKANKPFTLIILGLDRFRSINDALGHAGGDMALLEISSKFQSATEPDETLYRLSADEFVVLKKQGLSGIEKRFAVFKKVAETPILLHGQSFVLSSSAGISSFPNDGADSELLLKRASLALHKAKIFGRGKLYLYVDGMETESQLQAQTESDLRRAIEDNEFRLVFQPKGDMATGQVIGAEALIRWNHPTRGLLSPISFLGVAEECRLMREIDLFVLREAARVNATWRGFGIECPVSINLSTEMLSDRGLIALVKDVFHDQNVPLNMLEIEIPEGVLMAELESSIEILASLREMGVRISMDDFGTGYSSFSYLARFNIQTLKIDRSFISGLDVSTINIKIVRAIIQMARSLELEVVAEGVETLGELNKLKELHCNTVQGYFYAKPMTSEDFISFFMIKNAVRNRMSPFSI